MCSSDLTPNPKPQTPNPLYVLYLKKVFKEVKIVLTFVIVEDNMLDTYRQKLSWESMVNSKKDGKVRFGQIILKLVFLFALLITYSLLRRFGVFDDLRIKGINPSQTCITDSSHALFSDMLLAIHEYPTVRASLQILSSTMIDAVYIYMSLYW